MMREEELFARGALLALLLLPAGILAAWRWTAAMASGPVALRALVVGCAGVVPPLLATAIWATNGVTHGRAHALVAGGVVTSAVGAALGVLLLSLWPRRA
jgi:hypothetical protein